MGIILFASALTSPAQTIAAHQAVYDQHGALKPWTSWTDALDREMKYYLNAPMDHGYPVFATLTFMEPDYTPVARRFDFIPAMQNGMGVISYLKYWKFTGKTNPKLLEFARLQGNYIIEQALTPDTGRYPRFPRSTGRRQMFPQAPDCGSQADAPYQIEPDKGAIAGYALMLLAEETHEARYREHALHIARVLAKNMGEGTADQTPWPFRVDYRTGEAKELVAGNMSFILRLFDKLLAEGNTEFQAPRAALWKWILDYQLPSAAGDARLWSQFFEDHKEIDNRTAWSPLNLARYLVERKEAIDPQWAGHAKTLIDFVLKRFTSVRYGILVCGEQDYDRNPWGGVLTNFGGTLALYTKATGSNEYKGLAYQALTLALYTTEDNGAPRDGLWKKTAGGWQEDAHTDKVHNYVDALTAFPEWGR
ncbi:MAG: hypothetical protein NTY38_06835 [Acidobacteria bacterium]|nr:hypothetical protein [Acidobacteriota bacterium]